ncbi:MAG: hypothetical protein V1743_06140, partial [Nanoarchaeota archaeon]
ALTENLQGIPVCLDHKNRKTGELKCVCGDYVDIKKGKYGTFFLCMRCGPMNLRKIKECNNVAANVWREKQSEDKHDEGISDGDNNNQHTSKPKEVTVRSDDPIYFS